MNSESREYREAYAKQAGATVPCAGCGNNDDAEYDSEAEAQAYVIATNGWKRGETAVSKAAIAAA